MSENSFTVILEEYKKSILDVFKSYSKDFPLYVLKEYGDDEYNDITEDLILHDTSYSSLIQYICNLEKCDYFIFIPKTITNIPCDILDDIDMFFRQYPEYNILELNNESIVLSNKTYGEYYSGITVIRKKLFINLPLTYVTDKDKIDLNYFGYLLYTSNEKSHLIVNDKIVNTYSSKVIDKIDASDYTLLFLFRNNYHHIEKILYDINEKYKNLHIVLIDNYSATNVCNFESKCNKMHNVTYLQNNIEDNIYEIELGIDTATTKYVIFYEGNNFNLNDLCNVMNTDECSIYNNIMKINKNLYKSILRSEGLDDIMKIYFILMKVEQHLLKEKFNIDNFISKHQTLDSDTKKIIYKYIYDIR